MRKSGDKSRRFGNVLCSGDLADDAYELFAEAEAQLGYVGEIIHDGGKLRFREMRVCDGQEKRHLQIIEQRFRALFHPERVD